MIAILIFLNALKNANNFTIMRARLVFKRLVVFNRSLYYILREPQHNILVSVLERDGFDAWTVQWTRNWLYGCTQEVVVNGKIPRCRSITSVTPQDQHCLISSLMTQQDWVHPQKVCRWHHAEWCHWHAWGMRCHPEGPGQAGPWDSTRPSAKSCTFEDFSKIIRKVMNILQGNTNEIYEFFQTLCV